MTPSTPYGGEREAAEQAGYVEELALARLEVLELQRESSEAYRVRDYARAVELGRQAWEARRYVVELEERGA